MDRAELLNQAEDHLHFLCTTVTDRRVGGEDNRKATTYVKMHFTAAGWEPEETLLSVTDWKSGGACLQCGKKSFEVFSSLYSLGCDAEGELIAISSFKELLNCEISGKIVLLYGEIAAEQLMPKNFVFYNPDEHKQIIVILEKGCPLAIICATGRNSATAGGAYPYPLIEDGDFDIPSVYMKDIEGEKLLEFNGHTVRLISEAERIPQSAYNIVARNGDRAGKRIVISAHIDSKIGTPGAIDNATGVTVLLLLSKLLSGYDGEYCIEMAAFNGEDYYAVPGQMKYIEQNQGTFEDVILNINIDGAGYKEGPSAFSPLNLPEPILEKLDEMLWNNPRIVKGQPWYQGDHSIFLQYGVPAVAVSSNWFIENMECQDITHTEKDNLSIVSYDRVAECAAAIKDFVMSL